MRPATATWILDLHTLFTLEGAKPPSSVIVVCRSRIQVAVAVAVVGLTKRFFNHIQKDFLINVWGIILHLYDDSSYKLGEPCLVVQVITAAAPDVNTFF